MGLNISADVFHRKLRRIFQNMLFILVYIDDIIIIAKGTFEQHLGAIKKVLEKVEKSTRNSMLVCPISRCKNSITLAILSVERVSSNNFRRFKSLWTCQDTRQSLK